MGTNVAPDNSRHEEPHTEEQRCSPSHERDAGHHDGDIIKIIFYGMIAGLAAIIILEVLAAVTHSSVAVAAGIAVIGSIVAAFLSVSRAYLRRRR